MSVVDIVEGLLDVWLGWTDRPVTDPDRFTVPAQEDEEDACGDGGEEE